LPSIPDDWAARTSEKIAGPPAFGSVRERDGHRRGRKRSFGLRARCHDTVFGRAHSRRIRWKAPRKNPRHVGGRASRTVNWLGDDVPARHQRSLGSSSLGGTEEDDRSRRGAGTLRKPWAETHPSTRPFELRSPAGVPIAIDSSWGGRGLTLPVKLAARVAGIGRRAGFRFTCWAPKGVGASSPPSAPFRSWENSPGAGQGPFPRS